MFHSLVFVSVIISYHLTFPMPSKGSRPASHCIGKYDCRIVGSLFIPLFNTCLLATRDQPGPGVSKRIHTHRASALMEEASPGHDRRWAHRVRLSVEREEQSSRWQSCLPTLRVSQGGGRGSHIWKTSWNSLAQREPKRIKSIPCGENYLIWREQGKLEGLKEG